MSDQDPKPNKKSVPRTQAVKRPAAVTEPLDTGPLEDFLGYHLRLTQEASFRAFARKVDALAVKPQRYAILTLIGNNPGVTPSQLSIAAGRDKSTLTAALRDLQRQGFIERRIAIEDQRSARLFLTRSGETLLADLTRHAQEHEDELDAIIGPDKARMIAWLQALTAALSTRNARGETDEDA